MFYSDAGCQGCIHSDECEIYCPTKYEDEECILWEIKMDMDYEEYFERLFEEEEKHNAFIAIHEYP